MRIAIVGGIFGYHPDSWATLQPTPEINLLRGLRERGHAVAPIGIRDWRAAIRAASGDADVVHVHQIGPATLALALRDPAVPLVYTPHSCSTPSRWDQRIAHRRMLGGADAVVALSPSEASRYVNDRADGAVVIANGMAARSFPPIVRGAPRDGDRCRLLYVGQLIELKRVDLLIRAVAGDRLRGRCELRLVYHRDHCETELRRLARKLGVCDQVSFVGRRSGAELVREYHAAHILLLASRSEALPSVITEAMFTGLPVIAPDAGGIAWQLAGWGRCLPAMSVSAMATAITEMIQHYASYTSDTEKVAAMARARFGISQMIESHEDLYRDVIDRRNRRRGKRAVSTER